MKRIVYQEPLSRVSGIFWSGPPHPGPDVPLPISSHVPVIRTTRETPSPGVWSSQPRWTLGHSLHVRVWGGSGDVGFEIPPHVVREVRQVAKEDPSVTREERGPFLSGSSTVVSRAIRTESGTGRHSPLLRSRGRRESRDSDRFVSGRDPRDLLPVYLSGNGTNTKRLSPPDVRYGLARAP